MKEKGIEEVFKSAFNNLETDVDPQVWTNVQHAINPVGYPSNGVNTPAATPSGHGANGSLAGKAGVIAGKLGVKTMIAIVTAVTGVSVATYFMMSDTQNKKSVPPTAQSQQQITNAASPSKEPTLAPPLVNANNPVTLPKENTVAKQEKSGNQQMPVAIQMNASEKQSPVTAAPVKDGGTVNSSAVAPRPAAPVKPTQASNSPSAPVAKDNSPKPVQESDGADKHTYQNDFTDISDYLSYETASGKAVLPNVFTPNGDGRNDMFTIKTKNLKSLTVTVIDQSGKIVYQWDSIDGGWDGNLADGHPAPVGNYFYSLLAETMDGKKCIASSALTLRR